jgi:hypothetical protein
MQVINIHKRTLHQPIEKGPQLFMTSPTYDDLVWPFENCPILRFKNGLKARSKGGHGRNTIINFIEGEYIEFRFSKPEGFNGTGELKIIETLEGYTEIIHVIRT